MIKTATFSDDRVYRYTLERIWDKAEPLCVFIGLNPSTADEETDDATIRRCIGFAKRELCGGIVMLNLFAYRATSPKDMLACVDPIGPVNSWYIDEVCKGAEVAMVIAAWGNHGIHQARDWDVRQLVEGYRQMLCLGKTKLGQPCHPVRLRKDTPLIIY